MSSPSSSRPPNQWSVGWPSSTNDNHDSEAPAELLTLEERILYSAVPVPVDLVEPAEFAEMSNDGLFEDMIHQLDVAEQGIGDLLANAHLEGQPQTAIEMSFADFQLEEPQEIAFVDATVSDLDQVLQELANSGRSIDVFLIQSDEGLDRIGEILASRQNVDAIHLVSHGRDGQLQLGQDTLDRQSLTEYELELQSWRNHLSEDADLLIYGCDVAASGSGEEFVNQISQLTGADVAASDDLTGHAALNADWVFEYHVGTIETAGAFSQLFAENWHQALSFPAAGVDVAVGGLSLDHDLGANHLGEVTIATSTDSFVGSNGKDIYLNRYDADGNLVLANERINDIRNGDQDDVAMAMNVYGEFAVVWTSDGSGHDTIRAAFFHGDGSIKVADFDVSDPSEVGRNASVAISESGEIVIAWEGSGSGDSDGVFAKRFDRHGNQVDSTIQINTDTTHQQLDASVAMNSQGDWVVAWRDFESTDHGGDLNYSVYDFTGQQVIDNHEVLSLSTSYFTNTAVDISDSRQIAVGNTAVVRDSNVTSFTSSVAGVALFDYTGSWDTSYEDVVTTNLFTYDQYLHDVAFVGGNVRYVWDGESSDGSDSQGAFYRDTDINGNHLGSSAHVDGNLGDDQFLPKIASFHNDDSIATIWAEDDGFSTTLKLDVSATYVNSPPTGSDLTVTVQENGGKVIAFSDFGYGDSDTQMNTVRIDSLPANGELLLNGAKVNAGDSIDYEDIVDGNLVFVPSVNFDGTTSFGFTVNDGFDDAISSNTMTLDVQAVADESPVELGRQFFADESGELVNLDGLTGDQVGQGVAALANGGYVVVYEDQNNGLVYQRVFDSTGNSTLSSSIGTSLGGTHNDASVSSLAEGGYVVTWTHNDGVRDQIRYQVFDESGSAVSHNGTTDPQRVNIREGFAQAKASVAGLADGGFVVSWNTGGWAGGDGQDVVAKIFNSSGGSTDAFLVNQQVSGTQRDSIVESLGENRFVVGWIDQSVNAHDVKARVFDAGDSTSGTEITLTTDSANQQLDLQFARLSNGNFVAAWTSSSAMDGNGRGVFASLFDDQGNRISSQPFVVNEFTDGHQTNGRLVATNGGEFTVFFETDSGSSPGDASGNSILARRFDANGNALTGDMLIPTSRFGDQDSPEAVQLANGDILLAYLGQDGDHNGVDNHVSAANEFGLGIYKTVLRNAIEVTEGTACSLPISAVGIDSGHAYSRIEISNIPGGYTLTDGVNISSGATVDIASWNLSNLSMNVPTGQLVDFDLRMEVDSTDGADTSTVVKEVRVVVNQVDDNLTKPDFSTTTNEDSNTTVDLTQLTSGLSDADFGSPSEAPTTTFDFHSLPPVVNGAVTEWTDSVGGLILSLDPTHATFVEDAAETVPILRRAIQFDGNGGGTLSGVTDLDLHGSVEFWLKPDSLAGERLIFDLGDSSGGLAIYQVGSTIEARFETTTATGLSDVEPQVLVFDGLSTTEYSQVIVSLGRSAGNTDLVDASLFVDGELVDRMSDVVLFADSGGFGSSTIGVAQQVNGIAGPNATEFFQGTIAKLQTFDRENRCRRCEDLLFEHNQPSASCRTRRIDQHQFHSWFWSDHPV